MVRIRLVKKEDLPALASIYTRAYNSLGIGESWNGQSALRLMTFLFNDQQDLFFVAKVDHRVIGAIVATVRPWWDGNHLIEGELFVAQEFQGQKIGVQLNRFPRA